MDNQEKQKLFRPLHPKELLKGRTFFPLNGQIIFWHEPWQDYVVTVINEDGGYNVHHYELLPEGAPFQLIEAKLVFMPAPNDLHQKISMRLSIKVGQYVLGNNMGEFRAAPYDVQLDENNVLQPDLLFVSVKRSSLIKQKLFGAPEFVVEILSMSTSAADKESKKALYGKHGVEEYWMVHPQEEYVQVHHNENKEMHLVQTAQKDDTIESRAIEGLKLKVADIFQ